MKVKIVAPIVRRVGNHAYIDAAYVPPNINDCTPCIFFKFLSTLALKFLLNFLENLVKNAFFSNDDNFVFSKKVPSETNYTFKKVEIRIWNHW